MRIICRLFDFAFGLDSIQKKFIQALYALQDNETKKRETETLIKILNHLNINNLMIITKDERTIL